MSMNNSEGTLIYVTDPMCSWCYGFAPQITQVREHLRAYKLRLVMGGLRPYNTETIGSMKSFLAEHWHHVQERSGQPFNFDILDNQEMYYDTEPPARACVVMRHLAPQHEFAFFKDIQKAFYRDNANTNDLATYQALLADYEVDPTDFAALYAEPDFRKKTQRDFRWSQEAGIRGFPTTVLQLGDAYFLLSQGYEEASAIIEQAERIFAAEGEA